MGFKCGIVGLPNVGKSTLFNALTQAGIAASNYPFCTIEPNLGRVPMPDKRLKQLAAIVKPQQVIPTTMEFIDIAGLVEGASKGEGLGNQFLANIRETEAIAHVVRCFENDDVVHVAGKVDPQHDIDIINTELLLADMESVGKALQKATKNSKGGDKEATALKQLLEKIKTNIDASIPVRAMPLSDDELAQIKPLFLLTNKPTLYIANVSEDGFGNTPYLDIVKSIAAREKANVVAVCAAIEAEMVELEEADKQEFLASLGLKEPGLDRVIHSGYALLNLETFFTAGPKEVRAWTIKKGSTAPQAAGRIHTDFEKGFIRAEVIGFDDYIKYRGEQGAKDAGRLRIEGKDYIVQEGDVMHFRFNV